MLELLKKKRVQEAIGALVMAGALVSLGINIGRKFRRGKKEEQ